MKRIVAGRNARVTREMQKKSGLEPDQVRRVDVAGDAAEVEHQSGVGDDLAGSRTRGGR